MPLLSALNSRLREIPALRRLGNRYGRSYWQLPGNFRRRLWWESDASQLPGARTWTVSEPETIPDIRSQLPPRPSTALRLTARGVRTSAPSVTRLEAAWLCGRYAAPVTRDGALIPSAFRDEPRILGLDPHPELAAWLARRGWSDPEQAEPLDHVWPMTNRLQTNYCHWLVEWCGRLQSLERYAETVGEPPRLLIPADGPPYVRDSLALLGYGDDRCLPWLADSAPCSVRRLVLPSFRGSPVAQSPTALRWLRERLLTAAAATDSTPTRRIYISRAGGWRCVRNDEEVAQWCRSEGIEVLQPHRLSLVEQIQLFSSASLIIGLHGSGLTNLLFAPHAAVLEMFGAYGDGTWFGMATRLGQPYRTLPCESVGDDVRVDLAALGRAVLAFEKQKPASRAAGTSKLSYV